MSLFPFDLGIRWKWMVSPGSCTLEEKQPVSIG